MSREFIFYLADLTLRTFVIFGIAGLCSLFARRVQTRHALWTGVLVTLFLMPAADAFIPDDPDLFGGRANSVPDIVYPVRTFFLESAAPPGPTSSVARIEAVGNAPDWWGFASIAVCGIAALLLLRFAFALFGVWKVQRQALPVSLELLELPAGFLAGGMRHPDVRESSAILIPLTVGVWRPVLIFPAGWRLWEAWKLRAVLTHEWTHVRRLDWVTAMGAALAKCLFWFNPLVWWLERRLSSLAEQASDEACVYYTGDAPRYAAALLEFASEAKNGRRWIGGVAMAKHKISSRIERVLTVRKPGSGILSRTGWLAVCLCIAPVLYLSASAQSGAQPPSLPSAASVLPAALVGPAPGTVARTSARPVPGVMQRQTQVGSPPPGTAAQESAEGAPTGAAPQTAPNTRQVDPDLVGEIKLILTPVEGIRPGTVQIGTRSGTNRFTGNVVWTIRNTAVPSNFWNANGSEYLFALVEVDGRKLSFQDNRGSTFSYSCQGCSFLAWETGVGPETVAEPGILFRLSADGQSLEATCRAVECRIGFGNGGNTADANGVSRLGGVSTGFTFTAFQNSETHAFGVNQAGRANLQPDERLCVSAFGNVKADGTPFTEADCPGGRVILPSTVFFSFRK